MAIIDSIAMGKASGKIGNIVLSYERGQALARSCPARGKRKSSHAQVTSKQKFSSAYTFYLWQKTFLSNIRKLCAPHEQTYNAYLRTFYSILPTEKPTTLYDSILPFIGSKVGYIGSFTPYLINYQNGVYYLNAMTNSQLLFGNYRIRVTLINTETNEIFNRSFKCMPNEWTVGKFPVHETLSNYNYGAFYLYSTKKDVLSRLFYGHIQNG